MTTFRVELAEKPRDLLIYLFNDGPRSVQQLAERFDVPEPHLFAGGLSVLRATGLADQEDRLWWCTAAGARAINHGLEADDG